MSAPLHAADVARELGVSRDHFLRTRIELERRGFPKPLPLISRGAMGRPPLRWCAELIDAWKRGDYQPASPRAANDAGPRVNKHDRDKLKARLG